MIKGIKGIKLGNHSVVPTIPITHKCQVHISHIFNEYLIGNSHYKV